MGITVESLPELIEDFKLLFGKKFIDRLDEYTEVGLKKGQIERNLIRSHPLCPIWLQFKKDVTNSIVTQKLQFSNDSIRLLNLFFYLKTIKTLPGYDYLYHKIISKGSFFSAEFEALIATSYMMIGYQVEILNESDNKSPDFKISFGGTSVFVECKSITDKLKEEESYWDQFANNISKFCEKISKPVCVIVEPKKHLNGSEFEKLTEFVKFNIESNIYGENDSKLAKISISLLENYKDGIDFYGKKIDKIDLVFFKGTIGFGNNHDLLNQPTIVHVKQFYNPNRFDGIITHLKKAKKQLPKDYPAIVHIGLPFKSQEYLQEFYKSNYEPLIRKLNFDFSTISATVLSSNWLDIDKSLNTSEPIFEHVIIPNFNAKIKLPINFKLLGRSNSTSYSFRNNLKSGTFLAEVRFFDLRDVESGRFIFVEVSDEGYFQFKARFTVDNRFQIELINEAVLYISQDFIMTQFELDKTYRIAVHWDTNDINLFINGDRISKY